MCVCGGYESWKVTNGEEEKVDICEKKCVQRLIKIGWRQHVSHKTALEMADRERTKEERRAKKQGVEKWWRWKETVVAGTDGIALVVRVCSDPNGGEWCPSLVCLLTQRELR